MRAMSKSLLAFAAAAFLAACADPTGGGGGSGGGSGGAGSTSTSRSNARAMAVSNTGTIAVAQSYTSVNSGSIYNFSGQVQVSTDGGTTFTSTSPTKYYSDVKMSSDGTTIAAFSPMTPGTYDPTSPALGTSTPVTVSTDGGATWTEPTGFAAGMYRGWSVSPDGSKIFVVGRTTSSNVYYVSTDHGATFSAWTPPATSPVSGQTPTGYGVLAMTNDKVLVQEVGTSFSGAFLVSWSDFLAGTNWGSPLVDSATPPTTAFASGSISSDDQKVLLVAAPASAPFKLWLSSNGGTSFSELTSLESGSPNFADKYVLTSDGASIVHMSPGTVSTTMTVPPTFTGGGLEKASVSATSWTSLTNAGTHGWIALAIAPDGVHMAATDGSPTVYHSADGATFHSHGFANFPGGTPQAPPSMGGGGGGMMGGNYGTLTLTHGSATQETISSVSFQAAMNIVVITTSAHSYNLRLDSTLYSSMLNGSATAIPSNKINSIEIHSASGPTFYAQLMGPLTAGAVSITGTHTNGAPSASITAFETSTDLSFTSSTSGGAQWSDAVTISFHLTSTIGSAGWMSSSGGGGGGGSSSPQAKMTAGFSYTDSSSVLQTVSETNLSASVTASTHRIGISYSPAPNSNPPGFTLCIQPTQAAWTSLFDGSTHTLDASTLEVIFVSRPTGGYPIGWDNTLSPSTMTGTISFKGSLSGSTYSVNTFTTSSDFGFTAAAFKNFGYPYPASPPTYTPYNITYPGAAKVSVLVTTAGTM